MKKVAQFFYFWIFSTVVISTSGCIGVPLGIQPVEGFIVERYLGIWYEIARLDHSFERELEAVTARYSMSSKGEIRVVNRGYSRKDGEWKEIIGHAKAVNDSSRGHFKVSFFGPFYASYIVFGLDRQDYSYAFVSGYKTDYLWLLSREPVVSDRVMDKFSKTAKAAGFAVENLVWVDPNLTL